MLAEFGMLSQVDFTMAKHSKLIKSDAYHINGATPSTAEFQPVPDTLSDSCLSM